MKKLDNDLKDEQEDWRYLKQQLLLQGVDIRSLGSEDYYEFLEIWNAKPKEDRVVSAAEAHRRLRGG